MRSRKLLTEQQHQKKQTPSIGGGRCYRLELLPVQRHSLESDVNEKNPAYEQIRSVVNSIINEGRLQFAFDSEITRLQVRLHQWHNNPSEKLRRPIDDTPQIRENILGDHSPWLLAPCVSHSAAHLQR